MKESFLTRWVFPYAVSGLSLLLLGRVLHATGAVENILREWQAVLVIVGVGFVFIAVATGIRQVFAARAPVLKRVYIVDEEMNSQDADELEAALDAYRAGRYVNAQKLVQALADNHELEILRETSVS